MNFFCESGNSRIKGTLWGFKEINLKDMKGNVLLQKVAWHVQVWENLVQVEVLYWIIGGREYWCISHILRHTLEILLTTPNHPQTTIRDTTASCRKCGLGPPVFYLFSEMEKFTRRAILGQGRSPDVLVGKASFEIISYDFIDKETGLCWFLSFVLMSLRHSL